MKIFGSFKDAIDDSINRLILAGSVVKPNFWQSMDVSKMKAAEMRELLFLSFQCSIPKTIGECAAQIKPNLPWADDHFDYERVSGSPINPGETWKTWPWSNSADTFRVDGKQFDHSYAERYWGQYTRMSNDTIKTNLGARSRYGDLNDVIDRLIKDPQTRQAILSVWWPEDQYDYNQRVPCSLTYQFIMRNGYFHMIYNIRSCDAYRHFRDDLYLTARLLLWTLAQLQSKDEKWLNVHPGFFIINVGSFHCFVNDLTQLRKQT